MAKTLFSTGVVVSSTYLNSVFVTGGGHRHDGADDDGHCDQIDLESDVTGVLPRANYAHGHVHDGGTDPDSEPQVDLAAHVEGKLPVAQQWDSFELVSPIFSGFAAAPASTVICMKSTVLMASSGLGVNFDIVKLLFYAFDGTSNGTAFDSGIIIPEEYRPYGWVATAGITVIDGAGYYPGVVIIKDTGHISVRKVPADGDNFDSASALFAATGTKGLTFCSIEYLIPG